MYSNKILYYGDKINIYCALSIDVLGVCILSIMFTTFYVASLFSGRREWRVILSVNREVSSLLSLFGWRNSSYDRQFMNDSFLMRPESLQVTAMSSWGKCVTMGVSTWVFENSLSYSSSLDHETSASSFYPDTTALTDIYTQLNIIILRYK